MTATWNSEYYQGRIHGTVGQMTVVSDTQIELELIYDRSSPFRPGHRITFRFECRRDGDTLHARSANQPKPRIDIIIPLNQDDVVRGEYKSYLPVDHGFMTLNSEMIETLREQIPDTQAEPFPRLKLTTSDRLWCCHIL